MSAYFELDRASAGYRWRLKKEDGGALANAMRDHRNKAAALDEIAEVRRLAATATNFQIFRDGRQYRWRLRGVGGVITATSAWGFTRAGAQRNAELARRVTPTAVLRDLTGESSAPYDLGTLPSELTIGWPAPPVTTREETITTPVTAELRLEQANTRVVIRANVSRLTVAASDIDLQIESGVEIGSVSILKSMRRIRFRGGCFGKIDVLKPADFNVAPVEWREEWLAEDLLFEGVDVDSTRSAGAGYAFDIRGKRIAIIRSRIRAHTYCVWVGDTHDFSSTDIILAGNTFDSAGPQATVRFEPVLRSVVVENRMANPLKHNYRVHARSDLAFAARNTLIQAGIKLATEPGDDLGTLWVQNNTFHHTLDSLLDLDEPRGSKLRRLVLTGNTIYSNVWSDFYEGAPPPGWIKDDTNRFFSYRPFEG